MVNKMGLNHKKIWRVIIIVTLISFLNTLSKVSSFDFAIGATIFDFFLIVPGCYFGGFILSKIKNKLKKP